MSEYVYSMYKVNKFYGPERHILQDITLSFLKGAKIGVLGPNGAGKSTLLHVLAGLDTVTSGQVFIGDTDLSTLNEKQLTLVRREKLGFIFQAYNLVPTLDALENMTLPLDLAGTKPDPEWLDTIVRTVGLADRLQNRPNQLSGGQQQRVAVARALLARPEIIFADEPTGNLDSASGAEILALLRRAVDESGRTVVMVTHDLDTIVSISDRVAVLADQKIAALGTVAEVANIAHPFIEHFFQGDRGRRALLALSAVQPAMAEA